MDKYVKDSDIYDIVMSQFCASSDETKAALNAIIEGTRALPPADVRPVTLCRDCIYARRYTNKIKCGYWSEQTSSEIVCEDDFCSYGEKREGELMERNCYNCGYGGDGEEIDDYGYCWLHNGEADDNEITDPQKGCPEWTPRLEG